MGKRGPKKGHTAWNKGLTKETDERVKKYSESLKANPWCKENGHLRGIANKGLKRTSEHLEALHKGAKGHKVTEEHKEKLREIMSGKPKSEEAKKKRKQTILNKYPEGIKRTEEFKQKVSKESTQRWIEWKQNPEFIEKRNKKITETKRKNHTFNASKPEEELYKILVKSFGKKEVIRQYKEERYPYNCDFYIKSKDLFIELNFWWGHGRHPFNSKSKKDLKIVEEWIKKRDSGLPQYKSAVETWTKLDVEKQNKAKENNLNYIVMYNYNELNKYVKEELNDKIKW